MRIVTRLVIALASTTTAVMVLYGLISLQQREALLRDALIRETETLARSTQILANDALAEDRLDDLDRVLAGIADDPETVVAAVLDPEARVVAGGPRDALACAGAEGIPEGDVDGVVRGWNLCGRGARWVALPLLQPGSRVVLGRRATLLERDLAHSRVRIAITTLVLAAAVAGAIVLVLRRTLSGPLASIMRGVETLGGPATPTPIQVPEAGGELRDLAIAFNEMTERLEGKRRALVREVEERIALDRRVRQSEKLAAIGRLAGGLAHELGSPLNVIQMRAEAIEAEPAVPDAARRQADEIVGEVDRVTRLVRGLRQIAGRDPLEPRPLDLGAAAHAAVEGLRDRAEAAGVTVEFVPPDPGVPVRGDQTLLRHAIQNLVLNGIQAVESAEGGGAVRVRARRRGSRAEVVVEDDGPGIAPEHRSRIFEPFFTTREVGEGMGLGLAISRGIAEEHGGELTLEPREGGGVRAVLTLPLDDVGESA